MAKSTNKDFLFVTAVKAFARKHKLWEVSSLEDMSIFKVDQAIKMLLDGLKEHPEILQFWNNSPLRALEWLCNSLISEYPGKRCPSPATKHFFTLIRDRANESRGLIADYKAGDRGVTLKLKQRGLLS